MLLALTAALWLSPAQAEPFRRGEWRERALEKVAQKRDWAARAKAMPPPPPARSMRAPNPDWSNISVSGRTPWNQPAWEWAIDVNPTDPLNLVATANRWTNFFGFSTAFHTTDGGMSWAEHPMAAPGGYSSWGDPAVVFDDAGSCYFVSLIGQNCNFSVAFNRSTDKGATWTTPQSVIHDCIAADCLGDEPWVTCDKNPASPFRGRLYATWDSFLYRCATPTAVPPYQVIMQSRFSSDQGATWSPPTDIAVNGNSATTQCAPDGTFYILYGNGSSPGNNLTIQRSTDGGVTYGGPVLVSVMNSGAYGNIHPGFDIDRDPASPHFGRLYTGYTDIRPGTIRNHIYVRWSDNGGASWSAPVRVNDDPGDLREHRFGTLACSPVNGGVAVVWYDMRCSPGNYTGGCTPTPPNIAAEYLYAIGNSTDGGATWRNVRMQDVAAVWGNRFSCGCFWEGDYDGVAATAQLFYPMWGDARHRPDVCTQGFIQPVPNPVPYVTGMTPAQIAPGYQGPATLTGGNLAGAARIVFDTPMLQATITSAGATSVTLSVSADPAMSAGDHPWTMYWDVSVSGQTVVAAIKSGCANVAAPSPSATIVPTVVPTETPAPTELPLRLYPGPYSSGPLSLDGVVPGTVVEFWNVAAERVLRIRFDGDEPHVSFVPAPASRTSLAKGVYVVVVRRPGHPTERLRLAVRP